MNNRLKIVIIDYGVGNTQSVYNALEFLGFDVRISMEKKHIVAADALVLPGVGAFDTAANNLRKRGLEPILNEEVINKKKPILGVCVGMQLMATWSEENGVKEKGMNWIKGKVVLLELPEAYKVPHVGWNNLKRFEKGKLFSRLDDGCHFYFDHSYHFIPDNPADTIALCEYGLDITAAVQSKNIFGVQFHPEKSQINGLKLFRSFFNMVAGYA